MITIKEAAEYADKSESWIRKKILDKELAAEKQVFKYGKRWGTTKENIDNLLKQAKVDQEVIEVREVNKPVPAEDIINRILEATEEQNQALIDEAVNDISDKIDEQNELIKGYNEELKELKGQNDELNKQTEQINEKIIDKLDKQQEVIEQLQEEKNKSLLDKIKNLFT
jgi:chromosome segregation ATPase